MTDLFPVVKVFSYGTIAFLIALAGTPILTRALYRLRLQKTIRSSAEAPVFAKFHETKAGTPTMGGVLVWGTTLLLALAALGLSRGTDIAFFDRANFLTRSQTLLPLGALVASALVGLLDDILNSRRVGASGGGLRIRHRLLIYTAIAAVGAWWFATKLDWTTIHLPFGPVVDIGLWYIPIFLLVIVSTAFSVNEIDGLDGLAGGTLLAAFVAYAGIAFSQGKVDLAAFCAVIIGGLLAFLWFNIPPARFFMGDTGSMSLGVTLGVIAMLTNTALLLPLIGILFVVESVSVILQITWRKAFHRKLFASAPIHHHLEAVGWPESKIVMRFWIISAVAAVAGLTIALIDRTV